MRLDLEAIEANWRGSPLPGAEVILVLVAEARRVRAVNAGLVAAMERSVREGCTDHLDASEDAGAYWYDALAAAKDRP